MILLRKTSSSIRQPSGAAVNSNWGYHSSPVVTFLLALFNARLGWWLGNPSKAGDATYQRWFPRSGILTMFYEAFGLTDENYSYVDLSDGGHFDNMGLYEMVRRRCRTIVLIDAEADGEYTYEGLGMAIRKIRIDFGISITFADVFTGGVDEEGAGHLSSSVMNSYTVPVGLVNTAEAFETTPCIIVFVGTEIFELTGCKTALS